MRLTADDELSTADWAGSVCSSLGDWRASIVALTGVSGGLSKDALEQKFDDAQEATQQLVSELEDLGPPDLESGDELRRQLDSTADAIESDYESLKSDAQDALDSAGSPADLVQALARQEHLCEEPRGLRLDGMTGAQVARHVLDANGLREVPVEETPGSLSDHYDPRSRSVHLSPHVFHGVSIASTAVGAHEVGHAIRHAQAYSFFKVRSAMFPAVQFASNIWMLFLLGGLFLDILGFIYVAIALYSVAVLFQIVTLPVEFDASRRAKQQLDDLGLVASTESTGVQSVLKAACLDVRRRSPRRGRRASLLPLAALEPLARIIH